MSPVPRCQRLVVLAVPCVAILAILPVAGCAPHELAKPPVAESSVPANLVVLTSETPMTTASAPKLSPEEERALLAPYRAKIDSLDSQIVALLGQRFDVVRDVAALKAKNGIAPILPDRIEEVVQRARAKAEKEGVDPQLVEQVYRIIIDAACKLEDDYSRAQGAKRS